MDDARDYFRVCYYTKCVLLKTCCVTLKTHMCNITIGSENTVKKTKEKIS